MTFKSKMRLLVHLLFPLLLSSLSLSKSIHLGLHASWPNTPYSSEALLWFSSTLGNNAVPQFLSSLSTTSSTIPQVLSAFSSLYSSPAVRATLSWTLHARLLSPSVHLHHNLANHTLASFKSSPTPPAFAVRLNPARTSATILTSAAHIKHCDACETVEVDEPFTWAAPLPGEIEIGGPGDVILYLQVKDGIKEWVDALESVGGALRFWDAGETDYSDSRPRLQGYSVKVDLRKTEYKVIDDRVFETRLFEDCAYGENGCKQNGDSLDGEEYDDVEWLDGEEETAVYSGAKVMQYLTNAAQGELEPALDALKLYTEDTPMLVRSMRFRDIDEVNGKEAKTTAKNLAKFRQRVGPDDYLFINGHPFDVYSVEESMEKLLRCLSFATVSSMQRGELTKGTADEGSPESSDIPVKHIRNRLRVDLEMEERLDDSLVWFNDIFNDSRYKRWKELDPSNDETVHAFRDLVAKKADKNSVKGSEHLQLVNVRAHHLSLVVCIDPGDQQQFAYTSIPQSIIRGDLPIRIGLLLVPNGRVSSMITASFHYFLRLKGRKTAAEFLAMIQQVLQYLGGGFQQMPLNEQIVDLAFQQIANRVEGPYQSSIDVLDRDEEIQVILDKARRFAEEKELLTERSEDDLRANETPTEFSLLGILNGIVLKDISADVINVAIEEQNRIVQFLESSPKKSDESQPGFDQWVAGDPNLIIVKGLSQEMKKGDKRVSQFKAGEDEKRVRGTAMFSLLEDLSSVNYLHATSEDGEEEEHIVTVWLVGVNHEDGDFITAVEHVKQLAASEFAKKTRSRFAVLEKKSGLHSSVFEVSQDDQTSSFLVLNGRIIPTSDLKSLDDFMVEVATEFERASRNPQNGGDVGLIEMCLSKDTQQACASESRSRSNRDSLSSPAELKQAISDFNLSNYSYSTAPTVGNPSHLDIVALINPLEKHGFVTASVLSALLKTYKSEHISMQVMIAGGRDSFKQKFDLPSRFNKFFTGSSGPDDDEESTFSSAIVLSGLPRERVLTVAVEPPRAWFVGSHATNYDMDNVVLSSLPSEVHTLHAEYELKNLIVEGSCIDEDERPPQGLKLIIENEDGLTVDTLVMANLGYFQLKVPTPGQWMLRLAPGPSSEIFSLKAMEMYTGFARTVYKSDSAGRIPILVQSLSGAGGIILRVQRNPGMEGKSVLNPESSAKGSEPKGVAQKIKHRISSLYKEKIARGKQNENISTGQKHEVINVFSVASGHLYERFLKIMMTSATKYASRPIKFWLLENYLSPSFKKMLPLFAKKLGCEVGMVTYKWPGWLRAQTEKQRIIWAYKILFLDVLFPLDVGRIIFVDSDQVLRGDLAELMDIDLKGAPYGYVPFCDSRKEVEGFRFWKQGFWKDTLGDAKYRISALYVVDLIRFRETAAGDTLRVIYQSLSADPNSLSNLDQDLPNYASVTSMGGDSVPIFDLPADWLWCESWCDDESKKTAKAIDLCNNPMTKEPKLQSAKRIISEWVEYDDSASKRTEEIYKEIVGDDSFVEERINENVTCQSSEHCEEPRQDGEEKIEL